MAIDGRWICNIQGRMYVRYGGVLEEALATGLTGLEVELVQIPTAENGHTAISKAIATFEREGKTHRFTEYGDASPANCAKMVQNALIRMSATRAKGRALRDAIGHGEALAEELGEDRAAPADPMERPQDNPSKLVRDNFCQHEGCGVELTPAQRTFSLNKFGKPLCPDHQRKGAA